MKFTKEERAKIDETCEIQWRRVESHRAKLNLLRDYSEGASHPSFAEVTDKRPHIQKRLAQLVAMTRDEFMAETEADHVILGDCLKVPEALADAWFNRYYGQEAEAETYRRVRLQYEFDKIRERLTAIRNDPAMLTHVPHEDTYIWDRLNVWLTMSDDELRGVIEADRLLL